MVKLKGKNLQVAATISASILTACGGMAVMWPSPILPQLSTANSPIGITLTKNETSLVASLLMIGSVFGNMMLGFSIDHFGRKKTLLIASIPMFVSWLMVIFARSVEVLYTARFVMGFFQSAPMAITALYIGEIADINIRGKLSLISVLILETANVLTIVLGSYLSYTMLSTTATILPLIFFITFYPMPESPYFYVKKKQYENAEKSLQRLRNCYEHAIVEEIEKIRSIEEEDITDASFFDLFYIRLFRRNFCIMLGLKTLQQCSGTVAIQTYMKTIFEKSQTSLDPNVSSMISISIALPAILLSSFMVDKIGRKLLFYISTLGTMAALIMESTYFFIQSSDSASILCLSWLPTIGIFLFFVFRAVAITSIPYLMLGELFPVKIKGKATSLTLVYASSLASGISYGFPGFSDFFGLGTSFLIFAIFCFLGFWFVLFVVPETKGRMVGDFKR